MRNHQHFSHHHELVPLMLDEGEELNCNGCDAQIQLPFHGCISCEYYLHDSCLNTPRFLQHPYHPHHPLTLLPIPTYASRSFICDACGSAGTAFSFSCASCESDLHLHCAALPQTLEVPSKHDHVLTLVFGSPRKNTCGVCQKGMDPNHWIYYCKSCDFGMHLDCNPLAETRGKTQRVNRACNENRQAEQLREAAAVQKSVYEMQREMMEQDIANKLVLQGLENASSYVGPSYDKYYYY